MNLFRPQVMAARETAWLGGIRLQTPPLGWWMFCLALLATLGTALLLLLGYYTPHERAQGALVPDSGLLGVVAPSAGVVTRLLVREGEAVEAGQALAEISGETVSTTLGETHAVEVAQWRAKQTMLQSELDDLDQAAPRQERAARDRLDLLDAQLRELDGQVALQAERAKSAAALYQQWAQAGASGVVSKLQILQQRDVSLSSETELKALNGAALALRQQRARQQQEFVEMPGVTAVRRNQLQRDLADIARALVEAEAARDLTLRAPTTGTISNVLVHAGQSVKAQENLIAVLPQHAALQAQLWLPSRAIAFVQAGNRVALRYEAYPVQRFWQSYGRVRNVSPAPIAAADRAGTPEMTEPMYRVIVDLERQGMSSDTPLKLGMALEADILFEREPLFDWILGRPATARRSPTLAAQDRH